MPEQNLFSSGEQFEQLSPRDQLLATLNSAELFSDRTHRLQAEFAEFRSHQPPCRHCQETDHGIADCPRRGQYTGLSLEELYENFYAGRQPFMVPPEAVDAFITEFSSAEPG